MSTVPREIGGTALTRWREICDKCGASMVLEGAVPDMPPRALLRLRLSRAR
jgi:hypothetical protein